MLLAWIDVPVLLESGWEWVAGLLTLETASGVSWLETVLRLAIAGLLSGMIGWDRETRGRSAGLRTHVMVALGSAGFATVALNLDPRDFAGSTDLLRLDPMRMIAGLIGGVGFLGAGAIIQSGGRVRGLTTAAGLWLTAAVGLAAGVGQYFASVVLTVLAVITITSLRRLEPRARARSADDDARSAADPDRAKGEDARSRGPAARGERRETPR